MLFVALLQRLLPLTPYNKIRQLWPHAVCACSLALASATPADAQSSVTLRWNSNPEPDIAGYIINLGTTSGVYPTVLDVGKVNSHVLSGLTPKVTYYCALLAYDTVGEVSPISSEITFTLPSAEDLFNNWASAAGLSGTAAAPSAMPFHDGVSNTLKFAFNMNPAGPDARTLVPGTGTAGLPVFTPDRSGAEPSFTVEFLRRKGSGLIYNPEFSTDLVHFEPMTGPTTVTSISTTWERVVVRKPVTTPRIFGRVEVTRP